MIISVRAVFFFFSLIEIHLFSGSYSLLRMFKHSYGEILMFSIACYFLIRVTQTKRTLNLFSSALGEGVNKTTSLCVSGVTLSWRVVNIFLVDINGSVFSFCSHWDYSGDNSWEKLRSSSPNWSIGQRHYSG